MSAAVILAVPAALILAAALHGLARHGWAARLAALARRRPAPPPAAHHARHQARLRKLRGHR